MTGVILMCGCGCSGLFKNQDHKATCAPQNKCIATQAAVPLSFALEQSTLKSLAVCPRTGSCNSSTTTSQVQTTCRFPWCVHVWQLFGEEKNEEVELDFLPCTYRRFLLVLGSNRDRPFQGDLVLLSCVVLGAVNQVLRAS